MLARRHATKTGYDDALMLSSDGRIGEASMSNAFFVFNDHVATPPLNGILPGTRRAAILEFMEVQVREVFERELHDVVGIVLTSAAGIRPAASIQGRPLEVDVIERFRALQALL
jgi:branched-chain amino acid aminotransferase